MDRPADFRLEETADRKTLILTGDWVATVIGDEDSRLIEALDRSRGIGIDLRRIRRCDTAGAYSILKAAEGRIDGPDIQARPETRRLLELVDSAKRAPPTPDIRRRGLYELADRIGRGVVNLFVNGTDTLIFLGHLLVTIGRAFANPRKVRWAATFNQIDAAGLDAIPIIATTSFFIGAVVGLIGANMLTDFGAQVFTVELVGIAILREFGILITAVLLAGRSASSFTAEIGAMKMNQEIDAMQVLGVDPFDALVLPRFLGLFFTIPVLAFLADLAGMVGGGLVIWTVLGYGPAFFINRLLDNVGQIHFWLGMAKAPVLAMIIAGIGCRQGMEVGGDVQSLGERVTASVVHAIFAAILIDAVFALVYMQFNV
jgi:phospholipid/cholesterol/gamma-HCH transport system permease protein